jgi:hypothetical protein
MKLPFSFVVSAPIAKKKNLNRPSCLLRKSETIIAELRLHGWFRFTTQTSFAGVMTFESDKKLAKCFIEIYIYASE